MEETAKPASLSDVSVFGRVWRFTCAAPVGNLKPCVAIVWVGSQGSWRAVRRDERREGAGGEGGEGDHGFALGSQTGREKIRLGFDVVEADGKLWRG